MAFSKYRHSGGRAPAETNKLKTKVCRKKRFLGDKKGLFQVKLSDCRHHVLDPGDRCLHGLTLQPGVPQGRHPPGRRGQGTTQI